MIRRCLEAARRFTPHYSALLQDGVAQRLPVKSPALCYSAQRSARDPSMMSLCPFSVGPRDFSQPNESWSAEMQKVYNHYNALCEVKTEEHEKEGPWRKLPGYDSFRYFTGGGNLRKVIQSKARLFTRNIEEPGAAFEYVVFVNKQDKRCVCVLQAGHLLEGPPGYVHGGAIATMIDMVTGTLTSYLAGTVMTANLNIDYRSPIPLGSVVVLHSALDRIEGKKIFATCRVTSADESILHTEGTGLFISVNIGH